MNEKMEKEIKYPIKYAIMPIEEQTGWIPGIYESTPRYSIVANIAVKCYVVSEKMRYFADDSSQTEYEVVFLYDRENCENDFVPTEPLFGISGSCTNSLTVHKVFGDFEEAKTAAHEKNKQLLNKILCDLQEAGAPLLKDLKIWFQDTFEEYNQIECTLEEKTKNKEVTTNGRQLVLGQNNTNNSHTSV